MVLDYHRDQAAADEVLRTVQALGVPAIAVLADLSRVADIERLFAEAQKAFGCLVIVVANNDTKALVVDAGRVYVQEIIEKGYTTEIGGLR